VQPEVRRTTPDFTAPKELDTLYSKKYL